MGNAFKSINRDPLFEEESEQNVGTWNSKEVVNWLKRIGAPEFIPYFEAKRITGSQLVTIQSYKDINDHFRGIPEDKKMLLWKNVEILKRQTPCLIPLPKKIMEDNSKIMFQAQNLVLSKLGKLRGFNDLPEEDRIQKARNLFIADKMLASYLSESYIGTYNVIDRLYSGSEQLDEEEDPYRPRVSFPNTPRKGNAVDFSPHPKQSIGSPAKSPRNEAGNAQGEDGSNEEYDEDDLPKDIISEDTHVFSTSQAENVDSFTDNESDIDLRKLSSEVNENLNPHYNISQKLLRVKLVIVEIHQNNRERFFRHALSPIIDTFKLAPTFGIFHSAIIVGPFYLEFNDSGLCIPRKCCSKAAVLAADMSNDIVGPHITIALDRLSKVICHWNGFITYSSKKHNCQTFVDELCKALGIDIGKFSDSSGLAHYFSELRKYGKCDLKYVVNDELYNKYDWMKKYGKVINFKSHAEIDAFVTEVNEKTNYNYFQFTKHGRDDFVLLKSFDRAFWLRHFQNPGDEQFIPHNCPFGNPEHTGSMSSNWFSSST